jgi:hypothetical protein
MGCHPPLKSIGGVEGTRGSETSQYPQEEKTTVIPGVVVSETGGWLNRARVCNSAGVACVGLWALSGLVCRLVGE